MRKAASDSITAKIEAAKTARDEHPVPEGCRKLTKSEQSSWNDHISGKTDWKELELRVLHRIVITETELASVTGQRAILATPAYEKASGDLALHPLYQAVSILESSIRSDLKLLGLNSPAYASTKDPGKPKNSPGRGKKAPVVGLLK